MVRMSRLLVIILLALPCLLGGDDPAAKPSVPGIENFRKVSDRIYSGGQPEGDIAFEALKRQGIKTIVTVDGAEPDLGRAKRFGMHYVHLPMGYDGISREQSLKLIKAVKELPGNVFIHCHHGKHRGPTAVAICEIAIEGWDKAKAKDWMQQAGTDPKYRKLYEAVFRFVMPTADELAAIHVEDLPQKAKMPQLIEQMVKIDQHFDRIKALEKSGFRPDLKIDLGHETLLMTERFRELNRPEVSMNWKDDFVNQMKRAENWASLLENRSQGALETINPEALKSDIEWMTKSCTECHSKYRD
jgi:protein tyrosine phosphatase (PTP) superfamily phosphohydrolase (DUF442 family)